MLQKNPLLIFSRPLTYFGSYEQVESEIAGEELHFADFWQMTLDSDFIFPVQNIGLFIHWSDPSS
ncbi:MAG: hypothetical protein A3E80_02500 [Chlamydiae bacterium RIFCSPHIGHO2_12_FULL_49_9]|nr:MAG: hypothetical protein A3E80_02500 [Chlamydiae bacterium RIFCSPHIGHO2_12_FULL_49_9]HLB53033.1 hypothetical protein [Chlamydiales bacterium]